MTRVLVASYNFRKRAIRLNTVRPISCGGSAPVAGKDYPGTYAQLLVWFPTTKLAWAAWIGSAREGCATSL